MDSIRLATLPVIFQKLTDPRDPRGIRFPFRALCALVFLGLLARICEMAVLVRWAEAHWDQLREPLGFTRPEKPSATCISRALANLSLAEFREAFAQWITPFFEVDSPLFSAAIDGKTCRQGLDEHGDPEILLNVFLHDLKLAISQFARWKNEDQRAGLFERKPGRIASNVSDVESSDG